MDMIDHDMIIPELTWESSFFSLAILFQRGLVERVLFVLLRKRMTIMDDP